MRDARQYIQDDNYAAAIAAFEAALKINPNDQAALFGISQAKAQAGKLRFFFKN